MSATPAVDGRLKTLAILLQLSEQARQAEDLADLGFVIANETHKLAPYDHGVFLTAIGPRRMRLSAVSAAPVVDRAAPFARWHEAAGAALRAADGPARIVTAADLPAALAEDFGDYGGDALLWLPLPDRRGRLAGAVLLARRRAWSEGEINLLVRLAGAYGHALRALQGRGGPPRDWARGRWALRAAVVGAAVAALTLIKTPLTALAPAEVAPIDPFVIAPGVAGVVDRIHPDPSARVAAGDLLITLDPQELDNQLALARRALDVARAEFASARQRAFADADGRAMLEALAARVREREAELSYAETVRAEGEIRAPVDGLAIYGDRADWIGKPVRIGEAIMTVADPDAVELRIWAPVDDAETLRAGAAVRFFLNPDPLNPLDAQLTLAAYRAELSPEGLLAYDARARFVGGAGDPPRIGLRGAAKIYGDEVSLGYLLLRRPVSALRRMLGF